MFNNKEKQMLKVMVYLDQHLVNVLHFPVTTTQEDIIDYMETRHKDAYNRLDIVKEAVE
jgi:hypothetical protein